MLVFNIGFLEITWVDVADILLVSYLIYQLYMLTRGSVAVKVFIGIISIYLLYLIVKSAGMELLTSILEQFVSVGVLAAIILFQQEIRKFLILIGRTTFSKNENLIRNFFRRNDTSHQGLALQPILDAAKAMGGSNTGGLIVLSRRSELKFYAESGDLIDAVVSKRMLLSIFYKNSPLHDGAVIIANNRIKAARCILPVTESDLPASLGLRHRAALGMAEQTDSVVLIISEETGQFSIAFNGRLEHNLSITELREKLLRYLYEDEVPTPQPEPEKKAAARAEAVPHATKLAGQQT